MLNQTNNLFKTRHVTTLKGHSVTSAKPEERRKFTLLSIRKQKRRVDTLVPFILQNYNSSADCRNMKQNTERMTALLSSSDNECRYFYITYM